MLPWENVRAAVKPLRLIFWGGILWVFDLTFTTTANGNGFRCDILDDTVGTILITIGIFRLADAPVPGKYPAIMRFLKIVAIASIVETAMNHFIFPHPPPLGILLYLLGLCQLLATVFFCVAMRWFCEEAALPAVAGSWKITFLLFVIIYGLPLGLFYSAGIFAILQSTTVNFNLGAAGLLVLPIFAIPLIHLFVSTSRMRRAAESEGIAAPAAGGFPVVFPQDQTPPPQ